MLRAGRAAKVLAEIEAQEDELGKRRFLIQNQQEKRHTTFSLEGL
jgi:hypothetical protein